MQKRRVSVPVIVTDPAESAKAVGLRYVNDQMPGIRRIKAGTSFRYEGPNGAPVSEDDHQRIKSLVIPPRRLAQAPQTNGIHESWSRSVFV